MHEEKEFVIENYHRIATHANSDDGVVHWTLQLQDYGNGNIKR